MLKEISKLDQVILNGNTVISYQLYSKQISTIYKCMEILLLMNTL